MTNSPPRLLIATNNEGKLREMRSMLGDSSIELVTLKDVGIFQDVEEGGATFAENAAIKAHAYAKSARMWTISDDSGLEVDALGGAPGVLSARYAGEGATDSDRIEKLLGELKNISPSDRGARFVCSVAIADEMGEIRFQSEGICHGRIAPSPIGKGGFGYDPIFVPEGFEETFGELPSEVKDGISHRARALRKIIAFLLDFFGISA